MTVNGVSIYKDIFELLKTLSHVIFTQEIITQLRWQ